MDVGGIMKEKLMSIAAGCLRYSDDLKLDDKKMSNALGIVFRLYQDKIRDLTVQELSLLIAILSRKDKKCSRKWKRFKRTTRYFRKKLRVYESILL